MPYGVNYSILQNTGSATVGVFQSKIKYDIKSAAMRQGAFYYQVSLPHYRDPDFMRDGIVRYKMYLALKRANASKFLVPCYDIDLVWHTHQVHPALYYSDTMNLLGFVLKVTSLVVSST